MRGEMREGYIVETNVYDEDLNPHILLRFRIRNGKKFTFEDKLYPNTSKKFKLLGRTRRAVPDTT